MKKIIIITALCLTSCSTTDKVNSATTVVLKPNVAELDKEPVPGTVNEVWQEPMVDTIRIPGQIDPKGVYYRKAHNAIVQIRPGRFQQVEYPDDKPTRGQ